MSAKVFGAYSDKFLEYKLRSYLDSQEKKKNTKKKSQVMSQLKNACIS